MRKRTKEVKVRLTEEEYEALNAAYKRTGVVSREAFLRQTIEGIKIYERPPLDSHQLIMQCRRLGNNLNQMQHWAYAHGYVESKALRILAADIRQLELLFHDWIMYPDKSPDQLPHSKLHSAEEFDQALDEAAEQEEFNRKLEQAISWDEHMEELMAKEEHQEPIEEPAMAPSVDPEHKDEVELIQQPEKKKSWFRPRH